MNSFFAGIFLNVIKFVVTFLCVLLVSWSSIQDQPRSNLSSLLLIALGACLCMIASLSLSPFILTSPSQMLQSLMVGIALLGMIVIVKQKGSLLSIRLAGSIWFCGAVGLAIGAGLFVEGILVSSGAYLLFKWIDRYVKIY